jgi:hypothetical protein
MGFVPQHVQFSVKFSFLSKIYVITWKDGWNTSYLVATRCLLGHKIFLAPPPPSRIELSLELKFGIN